MGQTLVVADWTVTPLISRWWVSVGSTSKETAMLSGASRPNGPSQKIRTLLCRSVMMTRAGVRTSAGHGGRVLPLSRLEGEWSSRGVATQKLARLNRRCTEALVCARSCCGVKSN